jgi:5-(carboxyamino)imidazole ribonucleotide mutase
LSQALVGIIMGSRSDHETMVEAARTLDELGIAYEMEIVSAHRTPDRMFAYAEAAEGRGLRVVIAGAGGAAHLPGMTAAKTTLPVIGVPVLSSSLSGLDSLLSIVQMPRGVPVATVAIGKAGAVNAALLAAPCVANIDNIVVKKGCVVHEFNSNSQVQGRLPKTAADTRRKRNAEGAQSLSSEGEQMGPAFANGLGAPWKCGKVRLDRPNIGLDEMGEVG